MACLESTRKRASVPIATSHIRQSVTCGLTALAIVSVCMDAPRLTADDDPSPVLPSACTAACELSVGPAQSCYSIPVLSSTPSDVFASRASEPLPWLTMPSWQSRLVAIDADPASLPEGGNHGGRSILNSFEAAVFRPERPTFVLTSYEAPPASAPQQAATVAVDPNVDPNAAGLVTFEGCAPRPITFGDDFHAFFPRLAYDAWGVVNNWDNLIILGTALGGSLALRGDVDEDVRTWTAEHPDRWGHATNVLGDIGTVQYQIPVLLGVYAFTVWKQEDYEHQMMTTMISAYTVFGLSTLAIKGIADTKRPSDGWNGGNFGFPSWHDGSLFCISAVIDDYEGHWIGFPLYVLSGLVGWSRIDSRDHDLSDVIFGGVLGYVIGKSIADRALFGDSRIHILPYIHPGEGAGVMLDTTF